MTGRDISSAELLSRLERVEAELRRITGILTAAGGGAPAGGSADAWINLMARKSEAAGHQAAGELSRYSDGQGPANDT